MATGSDRNGLKTGLNISGGPLKVNRYTNSSARKYVAPDQVQNNDTSDLGVTSNSEHIVNQAAGLKSLSIVSAAAAAQARDDLAAARAAIASVLASPPKDSPKPIATVTAADVAQAQKDAVDSITARLGQNIPSVASRLSAVAAGALIGTTNVVLTSRDQGSVVEPPNKTVPEMDYVAVEMSKKRGTSDCFFARVVFSVPINQVSSKNIRAFRIFRSTTLNPTFSRDVGRLSVHAVDRLMSQPNSTRAKNQDFLSSFQSRLDESGVDNSISSLIPKDAVLGVRTSARSTPTAVIPAPLSSQDTDGSDVNAANLGSFIYPAAFTGIDRSVALDLNSIKNIQLANPQLVTQGPDAGISVGSGIINDPSVGKAQLAQHATQHAQGAPLLIVDPNNKQQFRELAFLSPDKLQRRIVGNYYEYSFDDETVVFGRRYRYYVVTVDRNLHESTRSKFLDVTIDGLRIPDPPTKVTADVLASWVGLTMVVNDQLVEKFEIYRREMDPGVPRAKTATFGAVSGVNGFTREKVRRVLGSNQYLQVGEALNVPGKVGATFYDRNTSVGRRYSYRIYSVDIFGNKSEAPKEVSIYVPDPVRKQVELQKPTLLVEVDAQTNNVRVTYGSEDPRIVTLVLGRRDVTARQTAFVPPGGVSFIRMGNPDVRGSLRFLDTRLADTSTDSSWSGIMRNDLSEHVFVDKVTDLDRSYQYSLVGIDRFGNSSPIEVASPVFVVSRNFINSPVNLSASVVSDQDGNVGGIQLSWVDSNISISAEELVGPQIAPGGILDTSVRNLFQLERRKLGEDTWHQFQMVTGTSYFDPASKPGFTVAPPHQPPLLETNETYIYRVQAFQTGGFISNFSPPSQVFIATPVLPPDNFRIRAGDTKVRPLFAMLNWDTNDFSGVVDHWEIERAVVNNYAASRLNFRNPFDFGKLRYYPFKKVYLESNRFQSVVAALNDDLQTDPAGPMTGQNFFMDMSVELGNSYFYRIRAVSVDRKLSGWSSRGIRMSDDIFDSKLDQLLSNEEKVVLASNFDAVSLKMDFLTSKLDTLQTSFGFHPAEEKPVQPPAAVVQSPSVFLSFRAQPTNVPTLVKPSQPTPFVPGNVSSLVSDPTTLEASYSPFDLSTYSSIKKSSG